MSFFATGTAPLAVAPAFSILSEGLLMNCSCSKTMVDARKYRAPGGFGDCARDAAGWRRHQSNMSGWVWRRCSQMGWKCSQPMYSLPTCSRL